MIMEDSDIVIHKMTEFIRKHNFLHAKNNERPWGSYELLLRSPNSITVTINSNQTFGWGFETEHAAAITLFRIGSDMNVNGEVENWMGKMVYSELVQLCSNLKKLVELQTTVDIENIEKLTNNT